MICCYKNLNKTKNERFPTTKMSVDRTSICIAVIHQLTQIKYYYYEKRNNGILNILNFYFKLGRTRKTPGISCRQRQGRQG